MSPKVSKENQKGESLSSSALWSKMEDEMLHNQDFDKQWPCEQVDIEKDNYPYPYLIEDQKQDVIWNIKGEEELEDTYEDG